MNSRGGSGLPSSVFDVPPRGPQTDDPARRGRTMRDVPEEIRSSDIDESPPIGSLAGVGLDKLEKEAIRQTLAMTGGNREQDRIEPYGMCLAPQG